MMAFGVGEGFGGRESGVAVQGVAGAQGQCPGIMDLQI